MSAARSIAGRAWRKIVIAPLGGHLIRRIGYGREPDFVIGDNYLRRWWLTPWSGWFRPSPKNAFERIIRACLPFHLYLHEFRKSDDDRALHDHPWANCSILLRGFYTEHTIAQGGVHHARTFGPGNVKLRGAGAAHRIEIPDGTVCWTLFVTGPVIREWGFHCPQGWRPWRQFVDERDSGKVGRGCA
jgi:hypothetical protein